MDEFRLVIGGSDLTGVVTAASRERTIEGASTVSTTLHDPARDLLRSRLVDSDDDGKLDKHFVELGGDSYALVKYAKQGDQLDLVWEDWAVWALRQATAVRKARRGDTLGDVTRAQFIRSLVESIKDPSIPFIAPEVNADQPIKKPTKKELRDQAKSWQAQAVAELDRVFPAHSLSNLAGKFRMNERQVRMVAELAGFHPGRAYQMYLIARGEAGGGTTRPYPGIVAYDNGIGLWQITPGAAFPNHDTALYRTFVRLGGAAGMRNPIHNARMAKAMFDAGGFGPWRRTRFWDEAQAVDWKNVRSVLRPGEKIDPDDLDPGDTRTITREKAYMFTVGPGGPEGGPKGENYWEATGRLAAKVGRRRFVVDGEFWYISEEDLFSRASQATISESDDGILAVDFDLDNGKNVKECTVQCRVDRWVGGPGGLITLENLGPADGKWLITSIEQDLFSSEATVTLRKPIRERKEPPAQLVTTTTQAGDKPDSTGKNGSEGKVVLEPGALKAGQNVHAWLLRFLGFVAGELGQTVHISYGTSGNHVAGSWHYDGNAADLGSVANHFPIVSGQTIGNTGGDKIAKAVAAVLGVGVNEIAGPSSWIPHKWRNPHDHKTYEVQVGWRTENHYDHVHVGVRPA